MAVSIRRFTNDMALGAAAAADAAASLMAAVESRGDARMIAATGAAQFHFLAALTLNPDVDWSRVELFHLDEYIGLPANHPASFRRFLQDRLIEPTGISRVHLLDGEGDPQRVCDEVGRKLAAKPVDLAIVGIGENGHLAFNDPPADFETDEPFIVVTLDEACRRQQVGEGWFASLDEVPQRALSMSVRQILQARQILCIVPESRKARAVQATLEGPISPAVPASILRTHPDVTFYLDKDSSALLAAGRSSEGADGRTSPVQSPQRSS
jgi:glucosamine-6-phosphate deaminase